MATTTTNFGWTIPQSTDLVKDGATAIATLGSGIDTSMAELKGGTTGQILSKTSGTDMDFTWITPNPGDITGVTAGTGITGGGTSGDVTVSFDIANYGGGQYAAGKNKIINGDFSVNQRSFTSTTTSATYGFDRWAPVMSGGTVTYSAQTFTAGTAPVAGYEGKNFARIVTASQSAASDYAVLRQIIESVRTLANNTVTVSFWAKAASGTPKVAVEWIQDFGTGGSPSSSVITAGGNVTLSTSWARYSVSFTSPSISGKTIGTNNNDGIYLYLYTSAGSNFNSRTGSIGIQNATIDIWGVQVEAGSTATPFQTATGTIQGELAACQRYYWRLNSLAASNVLSTMGTAYSTSGVAMSWQNPVPMRVKASSIDYSALELADFVTASTAITSATADGNSTTNYSLSIIGVAGTPLTQYRNYAVRGTSSSGYIGFSAEL